jgi:peptide/nickel transport system substrate-binding protein
MFAKTQNLHANPKLGRSIAHAFDRAVSWPLGQILTRQTGRLTASVALVLVGAFAATGCRSNTASEPATTASTAAAKAGVPRGGDLTASVRSEPRSFNRHTARDSTTELISNLTQGKLIHVNQATQAVEPSLAESWTTSPDGLRVTMVLRRDAVFSDGHPFTADDVLFAFEVARDEKTQSILADAVMAGGKPLQIVATDPYTVVITFPTPFAPGVRIFDVLPILPRHVLGPALKAGTFIKAWGLDTPPSQIVGLGPFVLSQYVAGQRVVLTRNPKYFAKAPDGGALPYLDRLTIEILPDQNAELLRLQSGQLDMMTSEISPESYASLKRSADGGKLTLLDLGVSRNAEGLFFNLKPGAFGADARAPWLQRDELRRAINMAVDRKVFVDTVFFGAGVPVYGPETPANKVWYWEGLPQTPYDPVAAKQLLASIGLTPGADGVLKDARNQPARFTLVTQKGRPSMERSVAVIRDELKKIGLTVDVVALDSRAVIQAFVTAKYDAIYFNADKTDLDPGTNLDYWLSSGGAHMWNLEEKTPATDWERQIDTLMTKQIASADLEERKRLYNEVQKIFYDHQPMIYFAAPRIYVAHATRVTNLTPAEYRPQLLWRPDTVAVIH